MCAHMYTCNLLSLLLWILATTGSLLYRRTYIGVFLSVYWPAICPNDAGPSHSIDSTALPLAGFRLAHACMRVQFMKVTVIV